MPAKLPPPQANVDNVLPGLLEDIRRRREAQQGAAPGPAAEPAPPRAPAAAAPAPRAGELDDLRAEIKRVRRWAALALVVALALAVAWLSGWRP